MARYGRDFGRDRWSGGGGYGQGGGFNRGEYGGMGSDASYGGGSQAYGGQSGFGTGGGAYDNDFSAGGYGGYGMGGAQYGGGQNRGGYGSDSGFSGGGGGYSGGGYSGGGYSGGSESGRGGGYGYGGGSGGMSGGQGYGGGGFSGGGYTGAGGYAGAGGYGGYGTGGFSGGRDMGGAYGGSGLGGGDEMRRLRAADIMTDNPETVTPDTSLADAARKMRDLDVGIIPVVDGEGSNRLRGVLTDRDIAIRAVAEGKDGQSTRVMEVMTTQVETCNKNDSLRDVMSVMEREQVRRVPVTDREGRLVGIIAQADMALDLDSPQGQRRFADTVEQISEPGNPRRPWGGRGSQGRGGGGGGGGLMGAVRNAVSNLAGDARSGMQGGEGQRDPSVENG